VFVFTKGRQPVEVVASALRVDRDDDQSRLIVLKLARGFLMMCDPGRPPV
jgi:hypothetical protein